MSRMLDALRHQKETPYDRDEAAKRAAGGGSVPAPFAQAFDRPQHDDAVNSGRRLGLALVLVAVTALLLWQVFAMNDVLPAGPLSRVFRPVVAERARDLPPAHPTAGVAQSRSVPPASTPASTSSSAPPAPAVQPPAPTNAERARDDERKTSGPEAGSTQAEKPRPAQPERSGLLPGQGARQTKAPSPAAGGIVTSGAAAANGGASAPAWPSRAPAGETDHFKLALYYQRVGDFENALIHYRAVLAADELNAEAHNNLGVLYQGKGLYDEAIKEFQRATFIDPRYDKAHNNLGVALLRSGKTDAAISEFRGIVAQDPRNVEALTNLALALKAAGRTEEARESLQRVLTINGRYAQAHYNLALLYEERAEWQRAIEHFEQFLAAAGSESAALTVDVRARVQALRAKLQ